MLTRRTVLSMLATTGLPFAARPAFAQTYRTQRWAALPNVPTMIESGFPTFPQNAWSGVFVPPRTPAAIVSKLNAVINLGLTSAEAKANLLKFSALTQPGSPEQFAKFVAEQSPIWAELVKLSGATIEN